MLLGKLSQLGSCRVLVVGDLMLDTYTVGRAKRISPEAPVAVVHVEREEHRPGGAGNVVLNLLSLGASVSVIGRVGEDFCGGWLKRNLQREGAKIEGVLSQDAYSTPVKNRIIADGQQVVRVDHEELFPLLPNLEKELLTKLPNWLEHVDIVAISDYGKGFLSDPLLQTLIALARERNIAVIADPKGQDFSKYRHVNVIKPNLSEAHAAAGLPIEAPLDRVAEKVLQKTEADALIVTRSKEGISLFKREEERRDFPVLVREVNDVTGAGDTVLAMLAYTYASGLSLEVAIQYSNVAAGIAIERFGCARVTLADLSRTLLKQDVGNKVFDQEHIFALQEVLKGHSFTLLGITCQKGITPALYRAIRTLAESEAKELILYIIELNPPEEFVTLLASLREVNFLIVNVESVKALANTIMPDKLYIFEEEELRESSPFRAFRDVPVSL